MKDYIKKLKSLGDETRVRILRLLSETEWLYVCEIVDSLEVPFYSISRHLKELENAGLVEEEKEGKFVKYFLKNKEERFNNKVLELLKSMGNDIFEKDKEKMFKRINNRKLINCKINCR